MTKNVPLFEGITDPNFEKLLQEVARRKFPKGIPIFDQGDTSKEIFLIDSGSVEIVRTDVEQEIARVALLKPGDIFGEFSYLTGMPRTNAALAMENVELLELKPFWLDQASKQFPILRERLTDLYRARVLSNVLRSTKIFRSMNVQELAQLARRMVLRTVPPSTKILKEGTKDIDLIVIKKGSVAITKQRGNTTTQLTSLGAGDVLGEMALITGMPRSASATAMEETEIMVLPGNEFVEILKIYPAISIALEDIVRSRAEQTRQALDLLSEEILKDLPDEAEPITGIAVGSLNLNTSFTCEGVGGEAKVMNVSRHQWTIEPASLASHFQNDSVIQMSIRSGRYKELASIIESGPLTGKTRGSSDGKIMIELDDEPRIEKIVTFLARTRFRSFVYPDYKIDDLKISLQAATSQTSLGESPVVRISQTHAWISPPLNWKSGVLANVSLSQDRQKLLSTQAVSLETNENLQEIQFEYETGEERQALDGLIRDCARKIGFAPSISKPAAIPASASTPLLIKSYRSPELFLRSYFGSMEAGVFQIETNEKLERGKAVRVRADVMARKSPQHFTFNGLVRLCEKGVAQLELEAAPEHVLEKIRQLSKRLVEQKTEASWENRKRNLAKEGVTLAPAPWMGWLKLAPVAAVLIASLWWAGTYSPPPPVSMTTTQTETLSIPSQSVTVNTSSGEVTFASATIRSISLTADPGVFRLEVDSGTYDIQEDQIEKLPQFFREQVAILQKLSSFETESQQ